MKTLEDVNKNIQKCYVHKTYPCDHSYIPNENMSLYNFYKRIVIPYLETSPSSSYLLKTLELIKTELFTGYKKSKLIGEAPVKITNTQSEIIKAQINLIEYILN